MWTAPAERSGDGAFERATRRAEGGVAGADESGVAASLCHRSPKPSAAIQAESTSPTFSHTQ